MKYLPQQATSAMIELYFCVREADFFENMDNSSILAAKLMQALLDGNDPSESEWLFLIDYLAGSSPSHLHGGADLGNHRSLEFLRDSLKRIGSHSQRQHFANTSQSTEDAQRFIQECLTLLQKSGITETRPLMGTTVVKEHSLVDYVNQHTGTTPLWTLHLHTQGQCLYRHREYQLLAETGTLVLIPNHLSCDYQRALNSPTWVHSWAVFEPRQEWREWFQWLSDTEHISFVKLPPDQLGQVTMYLQSAIAEDDNISLEWYTRWVNHRVEYLLLQAYQHFAERAIPLDERVQRALSFITDNFAEAWTLDALAGYCHVSQTRLSVLFKQSLGISPITWRDELRMREARRLLVNRNDHITKIAETVGYRDPLHFSRRFRQRTGLSPRQFRQAHRAV